MASDDPRVSVAALTASRWQRARCRFAGAASGQPLRRARCHAGRQRPSWSGTGGSASVPHGVAANASSTGGGSRRWYVMLAAVLVIAAAYRLPGVSWGFDIVDAAAYEHPHPDDGVVCFDAMERGASEITN